MGLRGNPDPVDAPEWKKARAEIAAHYLFLNELLRDREYLAAQFSYADIAFYMAQFFAARHTVPITAEHPNLAAWRERMIARPAVKTVVTAMAGYLRSEGRAVPELGGRTE
jgi:glutathione S-transferase